jgi:dimethylargininase
LTVTSLAPDENHPDSTFVEDTAVLTDRCAVLARPGAPSRSGEVASMRGALADFFPNLNSIEPPGTVDGGDVCEAGNHFFIGISERTNEAGAQQLAEFLAPFGYRCSSVDIRDESSLLHLKSGLAYLGDKRLVVAETLAGRAEFAGYDLVIVNAAESYAANCVRINDQVLVAAGYPAFAGKLRDLGYQTIALEMSEFQKMDGGLSCLSLRF